MKLASAEQRCEDNDLAGTSASSLAPSLIQRLVGRRDMAGDSIPGLKTAADAMPEELVELGVKMFGNQSALDDAVANASCTPMKYASVKMMICIADGDDAQGRLPGENGDGYGLDTLLSLQPDPDGMINIVDMGGNYGVVTIAAIKMYPERVRAVIAEPVPATYFFLRWNMFINGVPVLDEDTFLANIDEPVHGRGVVTALHKGVSGTGDAVLRICSPPWSTMNSYLSEDPEACTCNEAGTICHEVQSISSERMLHMFGSEDIQLLKLDCEGCEKDSLPVMANSTAMSRVKRLVGELHNPDPSLVELACKYGKGEFLTAWCRGGVGRVDGPDVCSKCNVW